MQLQRSGTVDCASLRAKREKRDGERVGEREKESESE